MNAFQTCEALPHVCKVPETQASLERTAEPTAKREQQSKKKKKADLEVCELQQEGPR